MRASRPLSTTGLVFCFTFSIITHHSANSVNSVFNVTYAVVSFFFGGVVAMEGRCVVETWAEFGSSGASCTPKIQRGVGTDVLLCTGSHEVSVFRTEERTLTVSRSYMMFVHPSGITHTAELHSGLLRWGR